MEKRENKMAAMPMKKLLFTMAVPLMLILAKHAGLPYVWFAFWVSELFAFLYSIYAVRREKNRKLAKFHTL